MTRKEQLKRMVELSAKIRKSLINLQEYDLLTPKEHMVISDIFIRAWKRKL